MLYCHHPHDFCVHCRWVELDGILPGTFFKSNWLSYGNVCQPNEWNKVIDDTTAQLQNAITYNGMHVMCKRVCSNFLKSSLDSLFSSPLVPLVVFLSPLTALWCWSYALPSVSGRGGGRYSMDTQINNIPLSLELYIISFSSSVYPHLHIYHNYRQMLPPSMIDL